MKKFLSILLSLSILMIVIPLSVVKASDNLIEFYPVDSLYKENFKIITLDSGVEVISFKEIQNGNYITSVYSDYSDITSDVKPTVSFSFNIQDERYYHFWMKASINSNSGDSIWVKFDNENYKMLDFSVTDGEFVWLKLDMGCLKKGQHTFSLLARERNIYIEKFIVSDDALYIPDNFEYYSKPAISPKKNTHPQVHFTNEDINIIKENLDNPENAEFLKIHNNALSYTFSSIPSKYDGKLINYIKSNAFFYIINDDMEKGNIAINTLLEYIKNITFDGTSDYDSAGQVIYTAALCYDWCYKLLSYDEKNEIINSVINIATLYTEMGWPPINQDGWGGHGAENAVLRDLLAFGIAAYDETTVIYDITAGKIADEYIDVRKLYYDAHKSPYGSDYGINRGKHDTTAMLLYKGLGVSNIWENDEIRYFPYWYIYALRPDNYYLTEGDSRGNHYESNSKKTNSIAYSSLMLSNIYDDGYLKALYNKEKTGISGEYLEALIYNDGSIESEDINKLPYSKYFSYPSGSYIARTGWDDNSVIVNMKVNELSLIDHNHQDAGGFQIYYKGNLATDSGYYQSVREDDKSSMFGSAHHVNYTEQTIAHNCILVYDPNEPIANFLHGDYGVNSGGQFLTSKKGEISYPETAEEIKTDQNFNITKVLAHEHNEVVQNPDYTYLKGDLANAYSDKVSEYERSFMFLNLHDEKIPAVLIVFDHVVSSDASFEKTYLLHGVNFPEIDGARTVLKRTETVQGYTYNGKLVNDTLLPKTAIITQVGSAQNEFLIKDADGNYVNYPSQGIDGGLNEGGGIRTEIKPKEANTEDYFLNVMQVTEADNTETLEAELIESETHTGVKIADRVVMLGNKKKEITDSVKFSFTGEGTYKISVSDLSEGIWYVYNNEDYIGEYEATEDGSTIYFEGEVGSYEILSEQKEYKLTVICGENGSTSLVGGTYFDNKITFSVTPDYGYIASVYLDGVDVTPYGKEEFSLYIGENSIIDITFTKDNENIYMYSPYTFYSHLNSYNGKNAFIAFSKLEGISKDNKIIDYGMLLSDTKENMTLDNKNVKKATVSETFGKELSDSTFAFGIIFYGSGLKNFTNYHIRPYVIYEKNGEEITHYGEIRTKYITNYYPYNDYVITNCEVN